MCAVTPPARLSLPMDSRAAHRARAFLREVHCTAHAATVLDEAQLLVSELISNAVRHGAPPVTLELECDESTGLTVRVGDGDPRPPNLRQTSDDDESGRGVLLVDLLSAAWGVVSTPHGKAVWFQLAAPQAQPG